MSRDDPPDVGAYLRMTPSFGPVVFAAASVVALVSVTASARAQVAPALVRGLVFDSIAMRPLRGARVQLVALPIEGVPRTASTDSAGAYQFDSLALGSYLLGFAHPRLDSLGLEPPLVRIDLRTPGTIVAPLAVPSSATLVRVACKAELRTDSTGILRGFARSARDGFPIPRARIRLEWPEYVLGRAGMERTTRGIDAQANESGGYLICGVPVGTIILANAFADADSSGIVELEIPGSALLRRDLFLGGTDSTEASEAADSIASGVGSGSDSTAATASLAVRPAPAGAVDSASAAQVPVRDVPRIRGVVLTSNGTSVSGARIRLLGSVAETTSRDDGSFALAGVASGTRMLDVRALGYLPGKVAVDVMGTGEVTVGVVLEVMDPVGVNGMTALDTLRVRGESRLGVAALAVRRGFDQRRQIGVGHFLTDSTIRVKAPHLPSELFRGIPGVTVTSGSGGQGVYMRESATFNASKGLCLPTIFVDGARAPRAPVDQMAIVSDMRAVEIYARGEAAPTQFQTSDGCGAIVLWTKTMWDASRHPPRR